MHWNIKILPVGILVVLAAAACFFSNKNAEAIDPTLQIMIQQDHAKLDLVMSYLTSLQEKGILPVGNP